MLNDEATTVYCYNVSRLSHIVPHNLDTLNIGRDAIVCPDETLPRSHDHSERVKRDSEQSECGDDCQVMITKFGICATLSTP